MGSLVKCLLQAFQTVAFGQIGHADGLQGSGFGGLPRDGSEQSFLVLSSSLQPLLLSESSWDVRLVAAEDVVIDVVVAVCEVAVVINTKLIAGWGSPVPSHEDLGGGLDALGLGLLLGFFMKRCK